MLSVVHLSFLFAMRFSITEVEKLPSTVGVYLFEGRKKCLYVGKSINIKARVKAHLEAATCDNKEANLIKKTDTIVVYPTENEYQAIILEAKLIQTYLPKYNVRWRDDKSFLYIKITINEEYPKVFLSRKPIKKDGLYFGPFSSVNKGQILLRILRKIIPFCTQKKLTPYPCFYSKMGLCRPCPSAIHKEKDEKKKIALKKIYQQNIKKLIKILEGKIDYVLNNLKKQLKRLIKEEKYEEAVLIRNQIFHLNQLVAWHFYETDEISKDYSGKEKLTSLISILTPYFNNLKNLNRIECYDVSNLKGKNATASLVVMNDGFFDKSAYRRFKIKNVQKQGDLPMMEEVFRRRFFGKKIDPWPDLIILDGGKPQLKKILKVLAELKINIPVIAIAKKPDRLIIGQADYPKLKLAQNDPGFNLIKSIRDEAHRFAHQYHLFLRKKNFLL